LVIFSTTNSLLTLETTLALPLGSHLGPYQIESLLGAGGMGEVYRAHDTRLGRDVAIKVLPENFAADAERLARFQREAQALASLNHPCIAVIYDIQEHGGTRFLVLELVEGETLADRIGRGALPLDDALPIAKQIADALEAAHEKGIAHRDLKPANVKITPDGQVKVLDFGLAKIAEGQTPAAALSQSPTLSAMATGQGVILGTAAYMSPEQARGKSVDKRADIWAFGCVLHEMLTGMQTFGGETISDCIAAILGRDPDFRVLPESVPASLRGLLQRCFQKDVRRRLRDIGEARIAIEDLIDGPLPAALPVAAVPSRKNALAWVLFAAAALLALALSIPAILYWREVPAPEVRLDLLTPATGDPLSFAISPDGRSVVFLASSGDGPEKLWLRRLDQTTAQPLEGTEGGLTPFWSPDSRSIGFYAAGKLLRLDLNEGSPRVLTSAGGTQRRGTWNREGIIVFNKDNFGGLYEIPASGGEPMSVTQLQAGKQTGHRFPSFLPDGRRFVFFVQGSEAEQGIYLGSLDGTAPKRLTAADTAGEYAPPGWLLYVRQGALVARRFDEASGELREIP
jgi:hypothetical protein